MTKNALQVQTANLPDLTASASQPRAGDRLDQFLQQWLEDDARGGGTVADVLQHPQVKKHGFLGRLNSQQQSLVTSVVSIMQDKSARDARHHHNTLRQIIVAEREALKSLSGSFAETARSLYRLPLLGTWRQTAEPTDIEAEPLQVVGAGAPPKSPGAHNAASAARAEPPQGGFLQRYLTWGNLIAGTAILLAVLVVKTSVATANFENQYIHASQQLELTSAELKALQADYRELEASHRNLSERQAGLQVRLEETEKHWLASQLTSEAEREQWTLERQQLRAALEQERLGHAATQRQLGSDLAELQQTLAVYRSKETQQDEHYQLWKTLAEQRQDEIARLQGEILALAAAKPAAQEPEVKSAPSSSRFFKFF